MAKQNRKQYHQQQQDNKPVVENKEVEHEENSQEELEAETPTVEVETNSVDVEESEVPTPVEEPIVEETPVTQPEPEVVTTPVSTVGEQPKLNQLEIIAKTGKPHLSILAGQLIDYENAMNDKIVVTEKAAAKNNFNLYQAMIKVLNTEDYGSFKESFDVINKAFITYKSSAYNPYQVTRGTLEWSWGASTLDEYLVLVNGIGILANKATRGKMRSSASFISSDANFTDTAKNNLERYYEV